MENERGNFVRQKDQKAHLATGNFPPVLEDIFHDFST